MITTSMSVANWTVIWGYLVEIFIFLNRNLSLSFIFGDWSRQAQNIFQRSNRLEVRSPLCTVLNALGIVSGLLVTSTFSTVFVDLSSVCLKGNITRLPDGTLTVAFRTITALSFIFSLVTVFLSFVMTWSLQALPDGQDYSLTLTGAKAIWRCWELIRFCFGLSVFSSLAAVCTINYCIVPHGIAVAITVVVGIFTVVMLHYVAVLLHVDRYIIDRTVYGELMPDQYISPEAFNEAELMVFGGPDEGRRSFSSV